MSDIREDGSEIIHYDDPDYPVFCRHNYIPAGFPLRKFTPNHFHEEVELIFIEKGMIHHTVNSDYLTLNAGDGLFINSRQFHELITDDVEDCTLYCLIFNPRILSNSVKIDQIVSAIADNENLSYVLLNQNTPWQKDLIGKIIRTIELSNDMNQQCAAMGEVFALWELLYQNIDEQRREKTFINSGLRSVKEMTLFIQNNYTRDLTLEEICEVSNVGKTKCTELFKKYVKMPPIEYLRTYRLEKSVELLWKTDLSVAEIAYEVGFSGASYYGEYFKKRVGMTPLKFRRKMKLLEAEEEQ